MKIFLRKLHRWLGLLMALQILAWMGSGLYFALFPIETIRGEHLTAPEVHPGAGALAGLLPPDQAWLAVTQALPAGAELLGLTLVQRMDAVWYRFEGRSNGQEFTRLVHARDGTLAPPLDEPGVRALAERTLVVPGRIESVEWVTAAGPGDEIRGRNFPLWRVRYVEPESLALYFDPWSGDLLARRTTRWRIFDFLWMLHIMDFDTRDDFNTPLLQVAAGLGFVVGLSGLVFWLLTSRLFRRRRVPQS